MLTSAETRYSQIECLEAVWACEQLSKYLYGCFTIQTDHKPLVPVINSKDINAVDIRCQRLQLSMMRYNGKAVYIPGKQLIVADKLSRHPSPTLQLDVVDLTDGINNINL